MEIRDDKGGKFLWQGDTGKCDLPEVGSNFQRWAEMYKIEDKV